MLPHMLRENFALKHFQTPVNLFVTPIFFLKNVMVSYFGWRWCSLFHFKKQTFKRGKNIEVSTQFCCWYLKLQPTALWHPIHPAFLVIGNSTPSKCRRGSCFIRSQVVFLAFDSRVLIKKMTHRKNVLSLEIGKVRHVSPNNVFYLAGAEMK